MTVYTLQQLGDKIRRRVDFYNSGFVNDATELFKEINDSYVELAEEVVRTNPEALALDSSTVATVAGTPLYPLATWSPPLTLSPLRWMRVGLIVGDREVPLDPIDVSSDVFVDVAVQRSWDAHRPRYNLRIDDGLFVNPTPDGVYTIGIYWAPTPPEQSTAGGTFGVFHPLAYEYITVDCMIKLLQKEESDVAGLAAKKERYLARIIDGMMPINVAAPRTIRDGRALQEVDYDEDMF